MLRIIILFSLILATASGCTYATATLADGTKITYLDFHPAGNAVSTRAFWQGVGSLEIDRDSADSSEFAESAAKGVIDGLSPLN